MVALTADAFDSAQDLFESFVTSIPKSRLTEYGSDHGLLCAYTFPIKKSIPK
jgi:hypothetical protein